MDKHSAKISKFLSLILRHKPQVIGLHLDANGWAQVDELIELVNQHGIALSSEMLDVIVGNNDKARFTFNADRTQIRANQGHSLNIDLDLVAEPPPAILFHGTATRFLSSIRDKGLLHFISRYSDSVFIFDPGQRAATRQSPACTFICRRSKRHQSWATPRQSHRFDHSSGGDGSGWLPIFLLPKWRLAHRASPTSVHCFSEQGRPRQRRLSRWT